MTREEAVRYLLGEGTEQQREAIERRLFENEAEADELAAVEDELVDAYVADALTSSERGAFEAVYLSSPVRSEKVAFAKAFRGHLSAGTADERVPLRSVPHGRPKFSLQTGLAAAAAILFAVSAYLAFLYTKTRAQLEQSGEARTASEMREKNLRKEIADLKTRSDGLARPASSSSPEALIASFELSPSLLRDSGDARTLAVPRFVQEIQLILPIEEKGSRGTYQASLTSVDGAKIWTSGPLKMQTGKTPTSIVVAVPASKLPTDDYILTLGRVDTKGKIQDVDDYYFRVRKS